MKKFIGIALVTTALLACVAAPVAATATYSGCGVSTRYTGNYYYGQMVYKTGYATGCNSKGTVQGAVTVSLRNARGWTNYSKRTDFTYRDGNKTCYSREAYQTGDNQYDYNKVSVQTH